MSKDSDYKAGVERWKKEKARNAANPKPAWKRFAFGKDKEAVEAHHESDRQLKKGTGRADLHDGQEPLAI